MRIIITGLFIIINLCLVVGMICEILGFRVFEYVFITILVLYLPFYILTEIYKENHIGWGRCSNQKSKRFSRKG